MGRGKSSALGDFLYLVRFLADVGHVHQAVHEFPRNADRLRLPLFPRDQEVEGADKVFCTGILSAYHRRQRRAVSRLAL